MQKIKDRYLTLAALSLLTLTACTSDDLPSADSQEQSGKTPIEVTAGIVGEGSSARTRAVTRSVVTTDPGSDSAKHFAAGTSLYMVIQSYNADDTEDTTYSRTIGYAQTSVDDYNTTVDFADDYVRYWESSHSASAKNTKISLYSACVPGYYLSGSKPSSIEANGTVDSRSLSFGGSDTYTNNWGDSATYGKATIAWPLSGTSVATQDATFLANQDLCFSNNISESGDGRIEFNVSDNKFKGGRMIFYHALTKVTFKIKKGSGFEEGDAFAFTNANENVVLHGFNTGGTFNITQGVFTSTSNTDDITQLAVGAEDGNYKHVLTGLLVPGTALTDTDKDIHFTIDNNLYQISKKQLADALYYDDDNNAETSKVLMKLSDGTTAALADNSVMRAGVHYIFTMSLGKQHLDELTAAVVPWETVTAEETNPSNARITVNLLDDKGDKVTDTNPDINLYRASDNNTGDISDSYEVYNWKTGYTGNKAVLVENTTDGEYTAKDASTEKVWYWPDNKTFYHLRTVSPKDYTLTQDAENGDYLTLTGAPYSSTPANSYKDVCWGAPFYKYTENNTTSTAVTKLTYSTSTGFDNTTDGNHQISKAIGATTDKINLTMLHMMSDVTINLTTPTSDDDDDYDARVDLTNVKMEMSNIYPTAQVKMGNGLVTPTGDATTVNNIVNKVKTSPWHYGFVPQSLDNVVLTITTSDNNQYEVTMDKITATTANVSNNILTNPYTETEENSGKYTIDRWYPNYKYTYTFKLTKTGVAKITATLVDWEKVTAGDDSVQIK